MKLLGKDTMTNPVEEIQAELLDQNTSLAPILRKSLVLSELLRAEPLRVWVECELNGYRSADKAPDYRKLRLMSFGFFVGPYGAKMDHAPIPMAALPDFAKEYLLGFTLTDGVGALETIARGKDDDVRFTWPPDLVAPVSTKIYQGWTCLGAYQHCSRSTLVQVLETIRTRLLQFIIELRKEHPEAASNDKGLRGVPAESVATMVVNYIYGGQNILASGSGFIQSVTTGVTAGDLDSLVRAMQELGLPPKSADELQSAVKSDPARAELNRLGDHVRKWYSRTVDLVLDGTVQLAASAGAGIILQLLGRYYGWP